MTTDGSALRRRLTLALSGFTVLAAVVLGAAYWASEQLIEEASLYRLLKRELDFLIAGDIAPQAVEPLSATLKFYRPARAPQPLPPALAALPPGDHRGVEIDGAGYDVLVREVAPGDRAYLVFETRFIEQRERLLLLAMAVGVGLIALVAWWFSGRIAGRVLEPLAELVQKIRQIDPERRGQRIDAVARDGELNVIVEALNAQLLAVDALVERERAFAAAASHELRTPLAVIRGASEVLAAQAAAPAVLRRIQRAVNRAGQDLDALLALSRGRELPPPQTLDLHTLLPQWAEPHLEPLGDAAPAVEWRFEARASVVAAPGVLAVIFTNLLRNAVAAAPGGKVRITVSAETLSIADDGPGLSTALLANAFAPGARGRDGGSGMGLYIADTLARRSGWTLHLGNADGGGAVAQLHFQPRG